MHQYIHQTFSNISANQEFDLDDVLSALKRQHEGRIEGAKRSLQVALQELSRPQPIVLSVVPYSHDLSQTHNALLAAEALKAQGAKSVVLNPGKNLYDQMIVLAGKAGCPQFKETSFVVGKAAERLAKSPQP